MTVSEAQKQLSPELVKDLSVLTKCAMDEIRGKLVTKEFIQGVVEYAAAIALRKHNVIHDELPMQELYKWMQ